MRYAVIRLSGHQHKVVEGDIIKVDRLKEKASETLLFVDGSNVELGNPVLEGIGVDLEIIEEKKDKKIEVRRFRPKSRYRKKRGHRQPVTILKVKAIGKGRGKVVKIQTKSKSKESKK